MNMLGNVVFSSWLMQLKADGLKNIYASFLKDEQVHSNKAAFACITHVRDYTASTLYKQLYAEHWTAATKSTP